MWEFWVKFYLGQYEDRRDSTSESSEQLFQRGRGKVSVDVILVEGGMHAHAQVLPKGFYESCEASAGHK